MTLYVQYELRVRSLCLFCFYGNSFRRIWMLPRLYLDQISYNKIKKQIRARPNDQRVRKYSFLFHFCRSNSLESSWTTGTSLILGSSLLILVVLVRRDDPGMKQVPACWMLFLSWSFSQDAHQIIIFKNIFFPLIK